MKSNRSLAITSKLQEFQRTNILGLLAEEYPKDEMSELDGNDKSRNRVFSVSDTLLTMILTASQADKTLKNSVALFYSVHQNRRKQMLEIIEQEKEEKRAKEKKSRGRPKIHKIPKSLEKDISLNTAAYANARQRIKIEAVEKLFRNSYMPEVKNEYSHWHGYQVMISDGTYLQMQDTKELRELYEVKYQGKPSSEYPKGLLQVIMNRGSGQLMSFKLSNRHNSELKLFH